jgi:TatA/E family protein of Tat protein translocase
VPFNLSTGELLVLLVVAVLVFGGRLPRVARKVGSAVTDLKRGMRDEMRRMDDDIRPPPPPPDWRPPQDPEPLEDSDETGK